MVRGKFNQLKLFTLVKLSNTTLMFDWIECKTIENEDKELPCIALKNSMCRIRKLQ